MRALLICFCYAESIRFRFKKRNCEADLQRIYSYVRDVLKCSDIEILTDYESSFPSVKITGERDFRERLSNFCSREGEPLFLYISAHSMRYVRRENKRVQKIKMILPGSSGEDKISSRTIQNIFKRITVPTIILLDICHSESLMIVPERGIAIGATRIGQTCGFHKNPLKHGSLFSDFLVRELRQISSPAEIKKLYRIDKRIDRIRKQYQKSPQNIVIFCSSIYLPSLLLVPS
ncbi:MAG: hypothetical protein Solivirus3_20 [Solivirus sp.]|uniref:Uncharacterized protein n=1 Tax=Solivirus sp. TaxID=2487772 RepID=A0A3G5AFQ8_9VIRU|nr:MAG: hypothetical protein Solivirus3_20 [Solivirus sp.]